MCARDIDIAVSTTFRLDFGIIVRRCILYTTKCWRLGMQSKN